MRNLLSALCSAALAACATSHHNTNAMETAEVAATSICSEVPFTAVAECVRNQFDLRYPGWRSDTNADLVNIFLAWSEAEAARVKEGTLSEEEARQRGFVLQSRLDYIAVERQSRMQVNSQAAAETMLAGFALISAGQAQPVMSPPTITPMPPRSPPATPSYFEAPTPVVTTKPVQMPLPPAAPIICNVNGDAQFATAVCR
jgi:hypothetical protein